MIHMCFFLMLYYRAVESSEWNVQLRAVENVTIFSQDVAQIERSVNFAADSTKEKCASRVEMMDTDGQGNYILELILSNFSQNLIDDTLRVSATSHFGSETTVEILDTNVLHYQPSKQLEREQLTEALLNIKGLLYAEELKEKRLQASSTAVENFVETFMASPSSVCTDASCSKFTSMLALQDNHLETQHKALIQVHQAKLQLQKTMKEIEFSLRQLFEPPVGTPNGGRQDQDSRMGMGYHGGHPAIKNTAKELHIRALIRSTAAGTKPSRTLSHLRVHLLYSITRASWSGEYDVFIRNKPPAAVVSGDDTLSEPVSSMVYSLTLEYYASIKQATGEDWNNSTLLLSNANPGGRVQNFYPEPIQKGLSVAGASPRMASNKKRFHPEMMMMDAAPIMDKVENEYWSTSADSYVGSAEMGMGMASGDLNSAFR